MNYTDEGRYTMIQCGLDYIVTEYVHTEVEKYFKNYFTNQDISFKRGKRKTWLKVFKTYKPVTDYIFSCSYDYSPILSIYTPSGEYGYTKLDIYASEYMDEYIVKYEYQCKGSILTEMFEVTLDLKNKFDDIDDEGEEILKKIVERDILKVKESLD